MISPGPTTPSRNWSSAAAGKPSSSAAKRFESSEQLSDAVSADPQGIGFIGLPYVRQAKAVAIVDGQSQAMLPLNSLIATEDYPLSRRLFFYLPPNGKNPWAQALVAFAQSSKGQAIVAANGFIAQTVQAMAVTPNALMPEGYQALSRHAQRLSVNFRFEEGSATLDNKARQDLSRVLDYIKQHDKTDRASDAGGVWRCQERPGAGRSVVEAAGHGGAAGVGEERRGVSRDSRIWCRDAGGGQ